MVVEPRNNVKFPKVSLSLFFLPLGNVFLFPPSTDIEEANELGLGLRRKHMELDMETQNRQLSTRQSELN